MYETKYLTNEQKTNVINQHAAQAELDWLNCTIHAAKHKNQGNEEQAALYEEAAYKALEDLIVVEKFQEPEDLTPLITRDNVCGCKTCS